MRISPSSALRIACVSTPRTTFPFSTSPRNCANNQANNFVVGPALQCGHPSSSKRIGKFGKNKSTRDSFGTDPVFKSNHHPNKWCTKTVGTKIQPGASPESSVERPASRAEAGPLAERVSDVFSESRASSLVEGLENAAQLGLSKRCPALSIRAFS
jgi:hypothetical protein